MGLMGRPFRRGVVVRHIRRSNSREPMNKPEADVAAAAAIPGPARRRPVAAALGTGKGDSGSCVTAPSMRQTLRSSSHARRVARVEYEPED